MFEQQRARFAASPPGLWYYGLESRERLALNLLVSFLLVVVFYLVVWRPVYTWRDEAERAFVRESALLEWMRQNEDAARRSGAATRTAQSSASLLSLVLNSARRYGITLSQSQPEGDDAVQVSVPSGSFDDLINWLDQLNRTNGVTVRQLNVNRLNEPGKISARLLLAS